MNYLKFSKQQLVCCFLAISNLLVFNALHAQGTSVKTNPTKAKTNGCEYQTISGLAEVISVEKVLPKDSSALEYDEYSIKFKFIPKEGGQLIASYRDQEMEFLLTSKGEKFRVGPQYIRQYQIRKNTKYSMKILQGPLCEEKIKFGETGGLPNDAFEAGDKVENIKKRRLEEGLMTAEADFAKNNPDAVPDEDKIPEEKTAEQIAAEAAEAERLKLEEEARIKRENEFREAEERLARKNAMSEGNPDEENNPTGVDETNPDNTNPNPDGGNPSNPDEENPSNPDNANPSDPDEEPKHRSTATVTDASVTDSSNTDNNNPSDNSGINPNFADNTNAIDTQKIAEEARLLAEREFAAQQAKEAAARKKQEEKEAAARKKQEEKEAKEKAKQEEKLRKEQEKIKAAEEARLARQREIEEQQRKAQEERLKKDLADKMRQDMLKEAEAKAKAEAEAKAKAEEEAKAAAVAKAEEEARAAAEKKAQEDELKRSECTYQTKIAGVIQVINVKKVVEAEQSRLGYAEYEVKVKFTPSNVADLPRNTQKLFDSEYTFVIDAQGKSANPSAAYIKKYSVLNNARFNGFAQIISGGICNSMIFFSPQLPIDAAQINLK